MFIPDVIHFRQFYASALGDRAEAMIARAMARLWPAAPDENILGLGFVTPYLPAQSVGAQLGIACMPAIQGALYWPSGAGNRVTLAHESELPFADAAFNRALLVHVVEHSEQLRGMLKELWRVMAPGGRMLVVVPNRLSLWARASDTPFGAGRPFSLQQCRQLFSEHEFTVLRAQGALFMPPLSWRWVLKTAHIFEALGSFFWPMFGGVWVVEVEKQVYAAIREPVMVRRPERVLVPIGAQPAMR